MNNVIEGINEGELSNLSIEILDYADRISEIFDKIDETMSKLPNHYEGLPCKEIMTTYNNLKPTFSNVKNNIISYSDDFIELIRKMQEGDKYFTTLFHNYTDETKDKIKSITD